jgi:tripartite-type tricarboxylate transporter receptor subunit TctC
LPYDAQKDFAPISFVANVQNLLVVNPSLGVSSLDELIALAKSRETPLNFASNGPGSSPHMAAALFMAMAGVEMRHIPYKGSAPAMTDLIGGQVDLMFDNLPTALPMARSGRVHALAVTGATRSPLAADIPTVAEAGLPGYDVTVWYGMLAPTGTPAATVSKISADLAQVLANAKVREQLIQLGTEPASMTPAEFTAFMGVERAKWGKIIRDAKISVE